MGDSHGSQHVVVDDVPAGLSAEANNPVGDHAPAKGLQEGDRHAQKRSRHDKGPAGEEQALPLQVRAY